MLFQSGRSNVLLYSIFSSQLSSYWFFSFYHQYIFLKASSLFSDFFIPCLVRFSVSVPLLLRNSFTNLYLFHIRFHYIRFTLRIYSKYFIYTFLSFPCHQSINSGFFLSGISFVPSSSRLSTSLQKFPFNIYKIFFFPTFLYTISRTLI